MKNYISVGITGGIGSGKSYVCQIINTMGYPVFYADAEAKKIITSNADAILAIQNLFGKEAYISGVLNRPFIANAIFSNPDLREKINDIVHPLVRDAYAKWAEESNSNIVFNEAAILFETGSYKNFDKTVLVTAPEDLKIKRLLKRDNTTEVEIRSRMNAQWEDEQKIPLADFIINNDEVEELEPQIKQILQQINEHPNS